MSHGHIFTVFYNPSGHTINEIYEGSKMSVVSPVDNGDDSNLSKIPTNFPKPLPHEDQWMDPWGQSPSEHDLILHWLY